MKEKLKKKDKGLKQIVDMVESGIMDKHFPDIDEKAIRKHFRKELLNEVDTIVEGWSSLFYKYSDKDRNGKDNVCNLRVIKKSISVLKSKLSKLEGKG